MEKNIIIGFHPFCFYIYNVSRIISTNKFIKIAMIYYISGGERSGKSSFAQKLALELSDSPIYLATAHIWDEDFQKRVKRHQDDRDERWTTIEEEKFLSKVPTENKTVVIDCVTLWLTNILFECKDNFDAALELAKNEFTDFTSQNATFIFISNELGMGVHADNHLARKFVELQGWMNQFIAAKADKAFFMVSGLPLTLK